MNGYYELSKNDGGRFRFNLKAGNHQVILSSQSYGDRRSAEDGIASVQKNGPSDARYERKSSTKGEPYFVLTATNGQVIGTSEMYSSESARDNGIESVKNHSPTATIKDLTGS